MNRMNGFNHENDPADDIRKWLSGAAKSEEMTICLFTKMLRQYKDVQIVQTCAAKVELTPVEYSSSDLIELDFDLLYKNDYICRIYKTWKDPGFRISRDLEIDQSSPDFKNKFLRIIEICTANFISFDPKEEADDEVILTLEIGIFEDGFNEKVLKIAVEVLEEAIKKIKAVLEE